MLGDNRFHQAALTGETVKKPLSLVMIPKLVEDVDLFILRHGVGDILAEKRAGS